MLIDACCDIPDHKPTRDELRARLTMLSDDRFTLVLKRALDNPDVPLERCAGGRCYRFYGSEARSENGLYNTIRHKIEVGWGRKQGMRFVETFDTSRAGRRGYGSWSHPDLVVAAHPRRRATADSVKLLHSFEIERMGCFTIESVYQAHAQGFGADYSWVAAHVGTELTDEVRIRRAAKHLGIGLIEIRNPANLGTWATLPAARRKPTLAERAEFLGVAMGQPDFDMIPPTI